MLRVGSVPYLVGRPLDGALADEPGIELSHDVPARLIDALRRGAIDVALVSSIELFRRPGYGYLEHLAVAGEGYVASVQVFLKRPLAEVRSVALDPASRTAATLCQVVWPGPVEDRPVFREVPFGRDPRATDADAWLRIGDRALRELWTPGDPEQSGHAAAIDVFNPSEEWARRTGLPFVFAPWIVRPGIDLDPWVAAFHRAWARGRERMGELADEAAARWGLPRDATYRYLAEECLYDPGERLGPALLAFRDAAAALGLCRGDVELRALGGAAAPQSP